MKRTSAQPASLSVIQIVDDHDQPLGEAPKEVVWRGGLKHRIVMIMIEDENGELLLQKRSASVDILPNTWDYSAAGHMEAGESYEQAAHRELKEEVGIDAPLKEIAYFRTNDVIKGRKLNRFNRLYKGRIPHATKLRADAAEVSAEQWFPRAVIKQMIADHPEQFTPGFRRVFSEYY